MYMCVCIYVYVYVCMYMCVCVYVCLYMVMCISVSTVRANSISFTLYSTTVMGRSVKNVCMGVSVYVCMCVYRGCRMYSIVCTYCMYGI